MKVISKEHERNIHESLDNAKENGYDPAMQTIDRNVIDLMWLDSYCEHLTYDEIHVHVVSYFEKHKDQ